jgi:hypothetical protein
MSLGVAAALKWSLSTVTFGPNEIASSIAIGKEIGSLLTHQDELVTLDVLEEFGVSITRLPPWLSHIKTFDRKTTVFRENMKCIPGPSVMAGVRIDRLHGMATLLVLCAQFAVTTQTLRSLLNMFLAGELGTVVNRSDTGSDARLVYNASSILGTFITACIDSDRDSAQYRQTRELNARLMSQLQGSFRGETQAHHRFDATKRILRDVFQCGLSIRADDEAKALAVALIHDTMHITSAYVALAAAANGANIRLDCHTAHGVEMITNQESNNETLLVRLWLTQPPPHILSCLSFAEPDIEPQSFDVAYGGQKELSHSCADCLGLTYKYATASQSVMVQKLWIAGIDLAQMIKWHIDTTFESTGRQRFLGLRLDMDRLPLDIDPPAGQLVVALQDLFRGHAAADSIRRSVAQKVHMIYRCSDYSEPTVAKEMSLAMRLVITSLISALITKTCRFQNITESQYAALPERMVDEKGHFWGTLETTLTEGAELVHLITAAVVLWGGGETNNVGSGGHVLGFVAPHCHVVMDAICDPFRSAQHGLDVPVLLVCRGSIPMLPRDKNTGWVKSARSTSSRKAVKIEDVTQQPLLAEDLKVLITFQPNVNDISCGGYCCWVNGILACEIDPYQVFRHLLRRPLIGGPPMYNRRYAPEEALGVGPNRPIGPLWLRPTAMLQNGSMYINGSPQEDKHGFALAIDAGSNASLAICAAGLFPDDSVLIHRGPVSSVDWASLDNLCPQDCIIFYRP